MARSSSDATAAVPATTRTGKVFAYVRNGAIREIIPEVADFAEEWAPAFVANCVEISSMSPMPQVGWMQGADGVFTAPPPVVLTPQQQMVAALTSGCQVASTGAPALSAIYDAIGPRWQMMRDEALHISIFQEFSGGLSEIEWVAMSGSVSFSTTAQFLDVVKGIAGWLTQWQAFVDGKLSAAPSIPVSVP